MDSFTLVLGDEFMGLYKNGDLVTEGVHLSFGDILEGCDIPCDIVTADLDWHAMRLTEGQAGFPKRLEEVLIEN